MNVDKTGAAMHCGWIMRLAKDYELNELSKLAADYTMSDSPLASSMCSGEGKRKWGCVYYIAMWRRWVVKMTLGRAGQVTLMQTEDEEKAVRFADMAQLFFWKYRHRKPRAACDADFNLNLETAKRELETNQRMTSILQLFEKLLLHRKLLDPCDALPIEVTIEDKVKRFDELHRLLCWVNEFGFTEDPAFTRMYVDTVRPMFEDVMRIAKEMASKLRTSNLETRTVQLEVANDEQAQRITEALHNSRVADNPVCLEEQRQQRKSDVDEYVQPYDNTPVKPFTPEELELEYIKLGLRPPKAPDTTNSSVTQ